jgi:hypothetical protein
VQLSGIPALSGIVGREQMATKEFLREALDHYKQLRQAKLDDLRTLDITIRQLQADLGDPPDQADPFAAGGAVGEVKNPTAAQSTPGNGVTYKPRVDEFFGMSIAEAARTYLDKIGHAMSVDDILKTITGGGCKVGGADPKRTMSITLAQGKREFVGTGGGNFGLRRFYPNMPKLGRPEASAPAKKKVRRNKKQAAKRIPKAKVDARNVAEEPKEKLHDKAAVSMAVAEALSDHEPKTPDEVLAAVQARLGPSIKKIAVYGNLRKKDYIEIDGGKYQLRRVSEGTQVIQ